MTIWGYTNGFESGSFRSWENTSPTGGSVIADAARTGAYGLRLAPTAAVSDLNWQLDPAAVRICVVRQYFRINSFPVADFSITSFWSSGGSTGYRFDVDTADNALLSRAVVSGVIEQEERSDPLSEDVWYRLDLLMSFISGDRFCDWSVVLDGDPYSLGTRLGPDNTYASGILEWRLGSAGSQTRSVDHDDHLMIFNSASDEDADTESAFPFGDGYTRELKPTSYGTPSGDTSFAASTGTLADSWQILDNRPIETNTSYIEQNVIGTGDYLEYGFEDLLDDGTEEIIQLVMPFYGQRSSGTASNNFKVHIIDGATDNTAHNALWLDNASPYAIYNNYGLNLEGSFGTGDRWRPYGDAAEWTRDRVDALLMRLGYSSDVDSIPRVPGVSFEVAISTAIENATSWGATWRIVEGGLYR